MVLRCASLKPLEIELTSEPSKRRAGIAVEDLHKLSTIFDRNVDEAGRGFFSVSGPDEDAISRSCPIGTGPR